MQTRVFLKYFVCPCSSRTQTGNLWFPSAIPEPISYAPNEQSVKKQTVFEALDSLDAVKCFAETHDKQMNVMLNEK